MVTRKTWEEFREIGLLWWINSILHMFGWALVYNLDENGVLKEVYPARVKFRGFGTKQTEEGYKNVSKYLMENANELYKESLD